MNKFLKKLKIIALSAVVALSAVFVVKCAPTSPRVATASAESVQQITDLTDTTWEFISEIDITPIGSFSINFNSNNANFTGLRNRLYTWLQYNNGVEWINVWEGTETGWINNAYRTITITGGIDVTNANLISWLEENAVQQLPPPPVDDLEYTCWVWRETPAFSITDNSVYYEFIFYIPDENYTTFNSYNSIFLEEYDGELTITYISNGDESTTENIVYTTDTGWTDDEYQYIFISRGADTDNADIINIIASNADIFINDMVYFFNKVGRIDGIIYGYDNGYQYGVTIGYNGGYARGFADGQLSVDSLGQSIWDNMFSFIQNFFNALIRLLSVELVRGVNIGLVTIGIPMVIWAIGAIIRLVLFFFGGK